MDLDEVAKAAAGSEPEGQPPPKKPSTRAAPSGPTLRELLPKDGDNAGLLDQLAKLFAGNPELEADCQRVRQLLAEAPLTDMTGLLADSPEYKERQQRAQLLKELACTRLLDTVLGVKTDKLLTTCRKLEKLGSKQWDPEASPAKMVEAVRTRVQQSGDGAGIGPIPMQPLITELTERAVAPLAITGSGSTGLEELQKLLADAKEKRVRKDPLAMRQTVENRLKKLLELAGGLQAEGKTEAAGQCMAAHIQLRDVYMQQFLPLVQLLGHKDAVDLALQVNSPLSDIDTAQWKQLSSLANGGQYTAILEKLGSKLPAAKPKPAARKGQKRSSSSSGSDSDASDSEGEGKHQAKRSRSKGLSEKGFAELASAIGREVGKQVDRSLSQAFRRQRNFGGGYGNGSGGRGGGRGDKNGGGRGGGRNGGRE